MLNTNQSQSDTTRVYLQALGLGVIAGLRSMTAPALLSDYLQRTGLAEQVTPSRNPLAWPQFTPLFKLLAAGELIADKLPFIPNRTDLGPLLGRALTGAAVGATLCQVHHASPLIGAGCGCLGALAGTFGGYQLRRQLGRWLHIPDPILGAVEDSLAAGSGLALLYGESLLKRK
jgi:uncharacterized membrane protein